MKSSCNAPFFCSILQRLKLVGSFPISSVQNRSLLGFLIWIWISAWFNSSSMYFLRLLQSLLHLPSLTATWCARCTVRTTSIPCTFFRGTFTHLCFCIFPSPTYLAGQPACWGISYICIAFQIKVCQGLICSVGQTVTGYVFLYDGYPRKQQSQFFSKSNNFHLSTLSSHRMDLYSLRARTARLGVTWSMEIYSHSVWCCPLAP